jgi:3-hydroxyisobutyrate dehydrogenase-like beta-hydroxyacid dehydrogenase
VRFAKAVGVGSPFGSVAESTYRKLCAMGCGDLNESQVIDACRAAPVTADGAVDAPP